MQVSYKLLSKIPEIIETDDVEAVKRSVELYFTAFLCIRIVKDPESTELDSSCTYVSKS